MRAEYCPHCKQEVRQMITSDLGPQCICLNRDCEWFGVPYATPITNVRVEVKWGEQGV
jgi:hypothetical protein